MTAEATGLTGERREVEVRIVDTDVHPTTQTDTEMREYLPEPHRSAPDQALNEYALLLYMPPTGASRADAVSPEGLPAGSDPAFTEHQLFEQAGIDYAMLITQVRTHPNVAFEAAICSAANDWLADTWLSRYNAHGRYRGTVSVSAADPALAVAEIERWAGHPYFAQVRLNAVAGAPYGDPRYRPIFAAATRHGLPVAIHVSKVNLLTPAGYLTNYWQHHAGYPMTYAAHLTSMVTNGLFDEFEDLRFVFVEGGLSWLLPLVWRMDRLWEAAPESFPATRRRPSEYLEHNVLFTSQPIEEPQERSDLHRVFEWLDVGRFLMYSSDYPHWDYDDPAFVIRWLPAEHRDRVLRGNALELYGLPPRRLAGDPVAAR